MVTSLNEEIRAVYVGAGRAAILLRQSAARWGLIQDDTNQLRVAKMAASLAADAQSLQKIVSWLDWSVEAGREYTKVAAVAGPVTVGDEVGSSAHQVTLQLAKKFLQPFAWCKFNPKLVSKKVLTPRGRAYFDVAILHGLDPVLIAGQYNVLLARLCQEGTASTGGDASGPCGLSKEAAIILCFMQAKSPALCTLDEFGRMSFGKKTFCVSRNTASKYVNELIAVDYAVRPGRKGATVTESGRQVASQLGTKLGLI